MQRDGSLGFGERWERKEIRITAKEISRHFNQDSGVPHKIVISHGSEHNHGDKWSRYGISIFCDTCKEPVGSGIQSKYQGRL